MQCFVAHVECTTRIIHFMKCTDIAQPSMYIAEPGTYIAEPGTYFAEPGSCRIQLFDSPGLLAAVPVTWDWLLPTQVQAHKFNRHQPWPLPPFLPAPASIYY